MAVQKSRRTPSTRGMRRSHDKLTATTIGVDQDTGEIHRRHHVTPNGFYRGRQVVKAKASKSEQSDNEE
jgi:large subunit ribosomal protein L32